MVNFPPVLPPDIGRHSDEAAHRQVVEARLETIEAQLQEIVSLLRAIKENALTDKPQD